MKSEDEITSHELHHGNMPKRNQSNQKKDGRLISQSKRAALKQGKLPTQKSLYSKQGHSSYWD